MTYRITHQAWRAEWSKYKVEKKDFIGWSYVTNEATIEDAKQAIEDHKNAKYEEKIVEYID